MWYARLIYVIYSRFSTYILIAEVESSRTSLALRKSSRKHFDALASKPQVLENCPVLGSRTAVFFELLKFWRSPEKIFEDLVFGEHLSLCPWSLALASSIPVLGLERVCPRKGCPWAWPRTFFGFLALALASSLVSSIPPLFNIYTVIAWFNRSF